VSAEAVSLKLLCSHGTARLVSHAPARPPSRSSHVGAPCRAAHLPVVYARGRCGLILKMKRYEQSAPEAQLDDAPQQCLIAYPMHPGDTLLSSHFFPPPPPQRTRSQTSRARPKKEKKRGHRGKAKELVIEVSCAACALQRHPPRLHVPVASLTHLESQTPPPQSRSGDFRPTLAETTHGRLACSVLHERMPWTVTTSLLSTW